MKKTMSKNEIEKISNALWKRRHKIRKYVEIMYDFKCTNGHVASDEKFQKKYKYLYGTNLSHLSDDFYKIYFKFLEDNYNNKSIPFEKIIKTMSKASGRIEASFSSKLLATINPNRAVWDKNVRDHLGIPDVKSISEAIESYDELETRLAENYLCLADEYRHIVEKTFITEDWYGLIDITDIKIIDLILWSLGKKSQNKLSKK